MRTKGTTTKMLLDALELREVATIEFPVLVYGADYKHASQLLNSFCRLCRDNGVHEIRRLRGNRIVLNDRSMYEFRSFYREEDSPRGMQYVDIFVDHYANRLEWEREWEANNG